MPQTALPRTLPSSVINFFFILGLISAFSFRVLIVLTHTHQEWFRPVWYLGTLGYVGFFLYRYTITQKRRRAIDAYNLIGKLSEDGSLNDEDREVLVYLLSSIKKSRENWNYLFIFILSFIAIFIDLLLI
ncbi:MAG: hypothetical protein KJ950_07410 [Proteobacteria bacterium]|nr:hypothetical protein [Pseudomonadota bacterium]MBU1687072.1 hypothetical protein [Pseudomonadota bacterium]